MGAYIYCLYSTEEGIPRYVGCTDDKVSYRFKEHVTAALEKQPGPLYDWIRDIWRHDQDIAVYTLQEGIAPVDIAMFEGYWIDQFAGLVNVKGNRPPRGECTATGRQVIAAIQAQLALVRRTPPR